MCRVIYDMYENALKMIQADQARIAAEGKLFRLSADYNFLQGIIMSYQAEVGRREADISNLREVLVALLEALDGDDYCEQAIEEAKYALRYTRPE